MTSRLVNLSAEHTYLVAPLDDNDLQTIICKITALLSQIVPEDAEL